MTDIIKSVAEAMQAVDGDFPMSIEAYEPFAKAAIEAYERVQRTNTSDNHAQKQDENEHIREMTVEQVASIMEDTIGYKFERSHKIAQALAKLGCIRIMGGV